MIKIRYRDPNELSPGLHAAAERHGRGTTVYLLPGLSAAQRRAALRRLRISAGRGQSPRLPASQLALALAADRVRTSVGRAGAVFRLHPAGSTVPVMVISAGAIAFLALSAVSIQVIHRPRDPGPPSFAGAAVPLAPVNAGTGAGGSPVAGLADPGQAGSLGEQSARTGSGSGTPGGDNGTDPAGSGTTPAPGDTTAADPTTGSGTTLEGSAAPTPTPGGAATDPPSSQAATAATPAASATTSKPSPTPTASKSGTCVNLGPLGVCL
jgi:hypothetical protein